MIVNWMTSKLSGTGATMPIKKVIALAHSGLGNLGCEATMAAFIRAVQLRHPGAEVWALTMNAAETERTHKIRAFPVQRPRCSGQGSPVSPQAEVGGRARSSLSRRARQWLKRLPVLSLLLRGLRRVVLFLVACVAEFYFLVKSSRRLKGTDLLVVVGSGQLADYWGGPWGYPANILKWCLLARARGAQVAFLSIGAGPINTLWGRLLLRRALSLAAYRSFRDESSRRLVESLGIAGENYVFPDLVHGLRNGLTAEARSRGAQSVVGINPLPYHDSRYWPEADPGVYERHVQTLASFAVGLLQTGRKVCLFGTQLRADPPVIKDVETLIRARLPGLCAEQLSCPPVSDSHDACAAIARTDMVVATRFHGVIFSLLMGRPVIAISYDPKTRDLMTDVGLGEFVADISSVDVPWLMSRFEQVRADAEVLCRRVEARTTAFRAALESQYDSVFGERAGLNLRLAQQTAWTCAG
jgi:polysaccharide pyruvyl transferase WcaK-like protein